VSRARGAVLAFALLASGLASGCLFPKEDGPRLAQPTDVVRVPSPNLTTPPTVSAVNFTDPGYVVNGTWRPGDEWDYESNNSGFRQVYVLANFTSKGKHYHLVSERTARPGQIDNLRRFVVDRDTWLEVNSTDDRGATQFYDPGIPLRQHDNGTYFYNITYVARNAPLQKIASAAASTRYPTKQTILFPWGFVEAARIEHRITLRAEGSADTQRSIVSHFVAAEYQNDVQTIGADDTWKLVAAKVGDFRRGTVIGNG
jgi:hypothetical protein